mmetsp:Transcript_39697/g.61962  ORF Transcript_39697/g.61962 Transcript_39697/m.61962 type:complete len:290 (+) Transcript_39697:414-1283(+)
MNAAGTAAIGASFATLSLPLALVQATSFIDSEWAVAQQRADKAGVLLAEVLMQRVHGFRPVTLVGFGLGARVIHKCLLHLAELGPDGRGIVETAACLGTPVGAVPEKWARAASVCSHRLINGYCEDDWVLALIYRASSLRRKVAGLQAIALDEHPEAENVIENINLTGLVEGHWDYRDKLPLLVHQIGLTSGMALPMPPHLGSPGPQPVDALTTSGYMPRVPSFGLLGASTTEQQVEDSQACAAQGKQDLTDSSIDALELLLESPPVDQSRPAFVSENMESSAPTNLLD